MVNRAGTGGLGVLGYADATSDHHRDILPAVRHAAVQVCPCVHVLHRQKRARAGHCRHRPITRGPGCEVRRSVRRLRSLPCRHRNPSWFSACDLRASRIPGYPASGYPVVHQCAGWPPGTSSRTSVLIRSSVWRRAMARRPSTASHYFHARPGPRYGPEAILGTRQCCVICAAYIERKP